MAVKLHPNVDTRKFKSACSLLLFVSAQRNSRQLRSAIYNSSNEEN